MSERRIEVGACVVFPRGVYCGLALSMFALWACLGCTAYDADLLAGVREAQGPGDMGPDAASADAAPPDAARTDAGAGSGDAAAQDAAASSDAAVCIDNPDPTDQVCPEMCPELCNGEDDDCDRRIDEALAQDACLLDNAEAACRGGACEIATCEDGYLDCDGLAMTGCEVDENTDPAHCGGCDNDCDAALSHTAETSCGAGHVCAIATCEDGFASCDGEDATGCETSVYTTTDCGGCASLDAHEPCEGLTNVTTSACPAGRCQVVECEGAWANCDGAADNGCEHDTAALGPCTPKRMRIAIDPAFVDEDLGDFPVLVRISDASLSASRADGLDLFFSSDGAVSAATALAFEVEAWDQPAGALIAWVRVPDVSSANATVFFLRYGDGVPHATGNDPTKVWDASFQSVHHFGASLRDSTAHAVDGTNQGSSEVAVGHIGGARGFGGSDYVNMGTGVFPNVAAYTLSAWVNVDLSGGDDYKYVMDTSTTGGSYDGMALGVQRSNGAVCSYVGGNWRASTSDFVSAGSWTLVAVRYVIQASGGTFESSVDGQPFESVFTGDTRDAQNVSGSPFQVGRWAGGMFYFDGSVDELRVASVARSNPWLRAAYENQRAGSTFLSVEPD